LALVERPSGPDTDEQAEDTDEQAEDTDWTALAHRITRIAQDRDAGAEKNAHPGAGPVEG
jgi:hypothetical protein